MESLGTFEYRADQIHGQGVGWRQCRREPFALDEGAAVPGRLVPEELGGVLELPFFTHRRRVVGFLHVRLVERHGELARDHLVDADIRGATASSRLGDDAFAQLLREEIDRINRQDHNDDDQAGFLQFVGAEPIGQEKADVRVTEDERSIKIETDKLEAIIEKNTEAMTKITDATHTNTSVAVEVKAALQACQARNNRLI